MLRELMCLAAVLTWAAPLRAQTLSWSTSTVLPSVRTDPFVQSLNGLLYVAGGQDTVAETSTTWAYNIVGSSWTALANMPAGRYQGSGMTALSGKLYLVGGWTVSGGLPNTNLWVYDPSLNTWTAKANLPTRSACGVSAAINGKLYVATPCDGFSGYRSFLHVYDPATDTWTALANSPHAHDNAAGGAINGKFYLAGGYDVNGATSAWLDVYDPASNTWTTKASMPTPRGDLRGAVLNGLLYAVGGSGMNGLPYAKVEVYDPSTDSWSTDAQLLAPTRNLGLAFNNTALYAVAGSTGAGAQTGVEVGTSLVPTASSGFAGAAQTTASILWTWTNNGPASGYRVMQGVTNLSGNLASGATQWLQVGLSANAQQASLFVQAFNSTGTANSGAASVYTLAVAPSAPSVAGVTTNSASVVWSTATNPANTPFQLEHSTDGLTFVLVSSGVLASYTDAGLNANATYYYRVKAFNGDSIASAYSPITSTRTTAGTAPNAPSGFAGAALSSSSIQWTWTDNSSNETGFRVMQGAANLSGDLAANTTSWAQTGLSANAQEASLFVQAFNSTGTTNSGTASRYSLALAPAPPAFTTATISAIGVQWSTAADAAGTVFQVERSTDGASFVLVSSGSIAAALDAGLGAGTTYFYRVEAFNGDALSSGYSPQSSTITLPSPVSAPTGFAGIAQNATAIRWTWVDNSTTEAGYRVMSGASNVSGDLPANATTWTQTALSTNTAVGPLLARAFNGSGGADSAAATVYTLASVPTGTAVAGFTATAATITWSRNQSPAATIEDVQRSTDGAAFIDQFVGTGTSVYDTGLVGCTTYYYRVRQRNGDGLNTAFDATVSFETLASTPAPAIGLTAQALPGNSIQLAWTPSPTEGVTGYRLFFDNGSGVVNYAAPLAVLTSTQTTFTTGVLISSPAYSFALRADHRCGVEEATGVFAAAASTGALAAVRAVIKAPDSGRHVNGNNVAVIADLVAGAPYQVQKVAFQFRASGATSWLQLPASVAAHPNPATAYPYLIQWDVTGVAPGSYDLRAVAVNVAGSSDTAPSIVTIVVDPVAPTLVESLVGGQAQTQQTLNNAVSNTVSASGAGLSDPVATVVLPAGALSVSTVVVTVQPNPTITTSPPAGFMTVGSAVQIDLGNGQHQLSGGMTANITLTYPNTVADPSALQIMSLDPVTGNWTQDFASTVNVASQTISGNTPHFSIFVVVAGGTAQTSLDSVRVYPNPFKPNGPNSDEGRNFSAGDPNSGVIFDNLTNDVTITIYTLSGRKVAELVTTGSAGKVRWDARNGDGRDVASGAYFAVFKSGGIKSVVKKFVIIR